MNYTGGPSISGCRPVLSLYPTHYFCQYLLLIFITFTNSFLFNRAFSTNSRSPLRRLRRHLSQRGRPWQAGQVYAGRLRLDRTQKGGPCLRGQRLLDNAPCQAVAGLDSGALLLPRYCASLVQTKADRHANGSPSGGAGEELATRLRGLGRCQTALTQRSYRSDKEPAHRCAAALSCRACPLRHLR